LSSGGMDPFYHHVYIFMNLRAYWLICHDDIVKAVALAFAF
jgi:hypothetical protein